MLFSCGEKKIKLSTIENERMIIYNYIDKRNYIPIMGLGSITKKQFKTFFRNKNKYYKDSKLNKIINLYIEECRFEGVNHDVALAQMCLETNFLKFTGDVKAKQNNFAGIGATGNKSAGNYFPNLNTGIRAHIQHLKAYASKYIPKNATVDPRYNLVNHGSCYLVSGLSCRWASDKDYGKKIKRFILKMRLLKN